jgi:hypothetical protein
VATQLPSIRFAPKKQAQPAWPPPSIHRPRSGAGTRDERKVATFASRNRSGQLSRRRCSTQRNRRCVEPPQVCFATTLGTRSHCSVCNGETHDASSLPGKSMGSDRSNHPKILDNHHGTASPVPLERRFQGRNGSLREEGPCPAPIAIIFRTTFGTLRTATTASSSRRRPRAALRARCVSRTAAP